jgi:hypothetical protein
MTARSKLGAWRAVSGVLCVVGVAMAIEGAGAGDGLLSAIGGICAVLGLAGVVWISWALSG